MLCVVPVLIGSFVGIALTFGAIQAVNILADSIVGRHEAAFAYHPLVFAVTILTSFLTVLISAWLPARKLSKMTPLEAIKTRENTAKTEKKVPYSCAFIWNRRGTCRECTESTEEISANRHAVVDPFFFGLGPYAEFFYSLWNQYNHTYFERYQDAWDVMATLEDTKIEDFSHTDEIHALPDTDSVIYQKANAVCSIGADAVSEEVKSLGGLETVAGSDVSMADGILYHSGSYCNHGRQQLCHVL